ncbi:MAG: zinc-dependent alcohol dehydrogenase family protein [Caldilineales bacterium]
MRAMVLAATGPAIADQLELRDAAAPEAGPGEVRLKVHACGVCHTDLHIVEGDLELPRLPLVPGHQIVGVVDQVGAGVSGFAVGDRAGLPWLRRACGQCRPCRAGQENLCQRIEFNGFHADGGFAEYVVAPAGFTYHLPAGFDDVQAAPLLCAGVIGYRALRLSDIKPGGILGLYGFGASAHVSIQVARTWGCEVFVFTRSEEHREHARALGAAWAGDARDDAPELLDSAVIFAPAGWIVPEALRVLRPGGTVACAGIHMSDLPQMPYDLLYGERTLRSVANSTRQDVEELLQLAAAIPIRSDVEVFPLEAANDALARVKHSEVRGAAVLHISQSIRKSASDGGFDGSMT